MNWPRTKLRKRVEFLEARCARLSDSIGREGGAWLNPFTHGSTGLCARVYELERHAASRTLHPELIPADEMREKARRLTAKADGIK